MNEIDHRKSLSSRKEKIKNRLNRFFSNDEPSARDLKNLQKIILLIILLVCTLIGLEANKSLSYIKYDRIEFRSAGSTLFANLYHPAKTLTFQEKKPLLIYTHGIGSKRDFDLRIPIEFTKRGFYIAALDYHGHGESGGTINDIDATTNIPALAQDASKLLEKLKTLPFFSDVNVSQIGLIGHSLGGMVVLQNQALNPEFKVTVAWAPLINFTPPRFGLRWEGYEQYIPVNLINSTNTENLLIIVHKKDEILNFNDALKAKELTNCTLVNITEPLLGGGHQLFSDTVLIESIKWFESHFFNSEVINGPIVITFLWNYVLIFINLGLLLFLIILLISYTSKFFRLNQDLKQEQKNDQQGMYSKSEKRDKIIKIGKILIYSTIFILNWQIFGARYGLAGIFYASLIFTSIFLVVKFVKYLIRFKKQKVVSVRKEVVSLVKEDLNIHVFVYTMICSWYFIMIYLIFSFYYPFAFMWPSNMGNILLTILIFPIYLSTEILFRKIIYPLLNFVKTEKSKAKITTIASLIIYLILMLYAQGISYLPSVLFSFVILLMVSVFNTIIFEHTKRFGAVFISSFSIIQLFFSAVISNVIGIGAISALL